MPASLLPLLPFIGSASAYHCAVAVKNKRPFKYQCNAYTGNEI